MKKNKYNALFRDFAKTKLSPTQNEQNMVSSIYSALQECLGECFISGSYARFTAIRPLHDLDIILVAGSAEKDVLPNPHDILDSLHYLIQNTFANPIEKDFSLSKQSHSITLDFGDLFSIDIVPCYQLNERNEFGDYFFLAPEILKMPRSKRSYTYSEYAKNQKPMGWIKTDPKGYIKEAAKVNEVNEQFRKTVKLIKSWRNSCKKLDDSFKLKSFHIEQIIIQYFKNQADISIYDAVFKFFIELPGHISSSQIPDKADSNKNIDKYIDDLNSEEKELIMLARDQFLYELENIEKDDKLYAIFSPESLISKRFQKEQFLFDHKIPDISDPKIIFEIDGTVRHKNTVAYQLHAYDLSQKQGQVDTKREIDFCIKRDNTFCDYVFWKVKNNNICVEPRGEITQNKTLQTPEQTKYVGKHYVQCFAIKNGECIAKSKIDVIIS